MKHSQTEKLNVFGVLLHSHLLGRALKLDISGKLECYCREYREQSLIKIWKGERANFSWGPRFFADLIVTSEAVSGTIPPPL